MATRSQSRDANHNGPRKRPSKRLQPKAEEPVDDSAWIHRDKLAAIEIQEMEDAGMHVRQPYRSDSVGQAGRTTRSSSRSMSRNGVRKTQSRDALADEEYINNQDDYEKKRVSTIQAAEEEEYYDQDYDPRYQADPRADDEYQQARGHTTRPSTSRIPVSKAAAASSEALDGAPRSRSGSGAPTSWEDMKRMRSGSAGSGILLDDAERQRTSPEREQAKKSTPKKTPTRSASTQRPGSSSSKRPSTSHRPEGEAPWIATMYKPDPRLPPDQQMLPTHAKRMMQEQWEREGKLGSTYDRDFNLLDNEEIHPPEKPVVVVQPPPAVEDKENAPPPPSKLPEEWPLAPERANGTASPRPGTANGGYRITPTINAHSPTLRQPSPKPVELAATEKPPTRLPDYNEKDEREPKKGCCCVVM